MTQEKVFIQIGAADGNDDFAQVCAEQKPTTVIFVEPQAAYCKQLRAKYANAPFKAIIEELAIVGDPARTTVTMFRPLDEWGSPLHQGNEHFSANPFANWRLAEQIANKHSFEVPCCTLNALLAKHGVTHVARLCIDTEGLDAQIINSIDFDKYAIDVLTWEVWDSDPELYPYHEQHPMNGHPGMVYVEKYLRSIGYSINMYQTYDRIAVQTHKKMPKVTFAVTAYNEHLRGNFGWLKQCIEIPLGHPGIDEVLVYDDGSLEQEALLRALPNDNKLKVVLGRENLGVFAAKIESIANASGDWVITMDSDNYLTPETSYLITSLPWQENTWYLPSFAMPAFDYRELCGTWTLENIHKLIDHPRASCILNTGNQTVNREAYMRVLGPFRGARMSPTLSATDSIQINMHWLYAGGTLECLAGFHYNHRIDTGAASNYNRGGHEKNDYTASLLSWLKQASLAKANDRK